MAAGLDFFKPEIWSGRILKNLNERHVYANLLNRDYEGEIKNQGDTVHINSIGRITVTPYVANSNITAAETLTSFQTNLAIDQAQSFNFQIDDIDAVQAKPKVMDEAMREAAYALARTSDLFAAALLAAATTNTIGTVTPTSSTAYEYLVDLSVLLDESDAPEDGRFVVVPPWYYALLLKDDRFVKYDKVGSALQTGKVGEAAGFSIHKSNNVPNTEGAAYKVIAGHKWAGTYAEQISKVVPYEMESRFNKAVKGLHLYGAKLVRDECVAVLTCNEPAAS